MKKLLSSCFLVVLCHLSLLTFGAPANPEGAAKPIVKHVRANDGLNLYCEIRGHGDTTLLFLHGWCGDHEYWKNQADLFAHDYQVVTVDQAGHSQSGKDRDPWTVGSLAADVGSTVKNLDLKRVILIGHSMGGPIGLAAAKQLPGKVIAVIGIDTLQNAEFKMPEDVSKQMVENFTADFKGAMRTTFKGLLTESADPALLQWLSAKAESQEPKMAITLIREIFAADTKTLMSEAKVPVRCINSSGGYQFFTPTAVDANAKYADYKAVFIDNVGHYPMLEKPDEFNRQLRTVLTEFMAKK